MTLAKHCVSRGCRALACYGFGSVRAGTIRFACAAHKGLIGFLEEGHPEGDAQMPVATSPEPAAGPPRPAAPVSRQQGSLFA